MAALPTNMETEAPVSSKTMIAASSSATCPRRAHPPLSRGAITRSRAATSSLTFARQRRARSARPMRIPFAANCGDRIGCSRTTATARGRRKYGIKFSVLYKLTVCTRRRCAACWPRGSPVRVRTERSGWRWHYFLRRPAQCFRPAGRCWCWPHSVRELRG